MELSDLEVFCCVVDAGGITRAAERLHRVPSNVTTRVRQLEDDLGVQLFIRDGKRLRISPAGERLRGYADRLLALAREARDALGDSTPRGPLRLGTMESTAATRLAGPLADYHRAYPQVALELRTGPTGPLLKQVIVGELDAALVAEPLADKRLERIAVFEEELVLVADAQHAPIRSPSDVQGKAVLAFGVGCAYRRRLETWFEQGDVMPSQVIELASYHAILGCAVVGMGVALVPRSVIDIFTGRRQLSLHTLPKKHSRSRTYLAWAKANESSNIKALADLLTAR